MDTIVIYISLLKIFQSSPKMVGFEPTKLVELIITICYPRLFTWQILYYFNASQLRWAPFDLPNFTNVSVVLVLLGTTI